jgi:hypothetical protein
MLTTSIAKRRQFARGLELHWQFKDKIFINE